MGESILAAVVGNAVVRLDFCMVSDSLLVANLILFWASRCVIPSVLTPSMAEMMSPWARLPPTALLPGVILEMVSGMLKSFPPCSLKPHGAGPFRVTVYVLIFG